MAFPQISGSIKLRKNSGTVSKIRRSLRSAGNRSSPRNVAEYVEGNNFGDALKNAGLKSKTVALSLKDRAAILLGGHRADAALWMSDDFRWMSSRYYFPNGELPAWVKALNEKLQKEKDRPLEWKAVGAGTGHSTENSFHYEEKAGTEDSFMLPFGVEKTVEVAEQAILNMRLGRSGDPDLLAISFSTHDFLGHHSGPNSREMEEITVTEDQGLARLLNFVNEKVPGGLRSTLIVMTGDHGIGSTPEYLEGTGIPAGRIDDKAILDRLNAFFNRKYKAPPGHLGEWVSGTADLNFYFNLPAIRDRKLDLDEMEKQAIEFLRGTPELTKGVAYIFSGKDVRARTLPPGIFEKQILNTYYSGRSGDLIVIPEPFFIIGNAPANHLSGYAYDRTVPLLLAGAAIRPGVYANAVDVIDIAPTLSFLTGMVPPANAEGRVFERGAQIGRVLVRFGSARRCRFDWLKPQFRKPEIMRTKLRARRPSTEPHAEAVGVSNEIGVGGDLCKIDRGDGRNTFWDRWLGHWEVLFREKHIEKPDSLVFAQVLQ